MPRIFFTGVSLYLNTLDSRPGPHWTDMLYHNSQPHHDEVFKVETLLETVVRVGLGFLTVSLRLNSEAIFGELDSTEGLLAS